MKAYVITSGQYSDTTIDAIFTDKTIAEEYIKYGMGYYELSEYELNNVEELDRMKVNKIKYNSIQEKLNNGYKFYYVQMDKEGNSGEPYNGMVGLHSDSPYYINFSMNKFSTNVWAKDPQHAIKIMNEYRTKILAKNLWGKRKENDICYTIDEI